MSHMPEPSHNPWIDLSALGAIMLSILGYLPTIMGVLASTLACVYYCTMIYKNLQGKRNDYRD